MARGGAAVTEKREQELREIVRRQIADALQDDLDGGERIMKEAWEQINHDDFGDEDAIMMDELRSIIRSIKERK